MIKNLLAILVGVLAGAAVIAFIEVWLMHELFEMPSSNIPDTPDSVAKYLSILPMGAKITIVTSKAIGAFTASKVASLISGRNRKSALFTGILLLVFIIGNLINIHHPVWMDFCIPAAAVVGTWIGSKNTY